MTKPAEAEVRGDEIVIRLPISVIAGAVEWLVAPFDQPAIVVTNAEEFAFGVVRALNRDDDAGRTLVHKMFDEAFIAAFEDGSDGVAETERCESCGLPIARKADGIDGAHDTEDGVWICRGCDDAGEVPR